ncbi:MAG: hypothetical protein U0M23_02390 [Acutalibacteraceae bacterium]|nr:hypothetical protein [Acutalibacteraceae bacterium]
MMKHRIPIHQYTVSQISLREYDFQQVQKILGAHKSYGTHYIKLLIKLLCDVQQKQTITDC